MHAGQCREEAWGLPGGEESTLKTDPVLGSWGGVGVEGSECHRPRYLSVARLAVTSFPLCALGSAYLTGKHQANWSSVIPGCCLPAAIKTEHGRQTHCFQVLC